MISHYVLEFSYLTCRKGAHTQSPRTKIAAAKTQISLYALLQSQFSPKLGMPFTSPNAFYLTARKGSSRTWEGPAQSLPPLPLPATEHVGHFCTRTIQNKVAKISLVKGAIAQVCTFPRRSSVPGGESEGLLWTLIHPRGWTSHQAKKPRTLHPRSRQAGGSHPIHCSLYTNFIFSLNS